MTDSQIKQLIDTFLDKRKPQTRYTSFDYCFNYFRSFKQQGRLRELVTKENVEKSCLQLAFFLASWGMFRMSGKLGQEVNAKHFLRLIDEISMWDGSHACASIWDIDVPDYEKPETRAFLKDCYEQIKELALLPGQKQHQTLTTKIMLGVFGCVPAFDTFFTQTFHVSTFNPDALSKIHDFYCKHHGVINEYANKIKTLDFKTDPASNVRYTKAKLIDMVGFQQGKNKADAEKRKRKAEKRFSHRGNLLLKT